MDVRGEAVEAGRDHALQRLNVDRPAQSPLKIHRQSRADEYLDGRRHQSYLLIVVDVAPTSTGTEGDISHICLL